MTLRVSMMITSDITNRSISFAFSRRGVACGDRTGRVLATTTVAASDAPTDLSFVKQPLRATLPKSPFSYHVGQRSEPSCSPAKRGVSCSNSIVIILVTIHTVSPVLFARL